MIREAYNIAKGCYMLIKKVEKGVRGMPGLLEAKKDVISCEKPRGFANKI